MRKLEQRLLRWHFINHILTGLYYILIILIAFKINDSLIRVLSVVATIVLFIIATIIINIKQEQIQKEVILNRLKILDKMIDGFDERS